MAKIVVDKKKVDKKFVKAWVKALRSGKFKQARSYLESPNAHTPGFCCLGVACKVQGKLSKKKATTYAAQKDLPLSQQGAVNVEWFGKVMGVTDAADLQEKLAAYNDTSKWSFKRIATYLEKNFL